METEPKRNDYIAVLEAAILINLKCVPAYRETVFVRERTSDQETVWEGDIEVFDLPGHPDAKTCYAWQHTDEDGRQKIFTVPENQFVDSARKAVQAAIFAGAQPPVRRNFKDLKFLIHQLEECKSILRRIGMRAENLAEAIETSREIHGKIGLNPNSVN